MPLVLLDEQLQAPVLRKTQLPQEAAPELLARLAAQYGEAADPAAMDAAREQDKRRQLWEYLGNSLTQTWHGMAGMKPPTPIQSPSEVDALTQRRQALAQHLGLAGAVQGWQRAEEEHARRQGELLEARSADSGRSQQARALVKTAVEALRARGVEVPDIDLDTATAADLADVMPLYEKLAAGTLGPQTVAPYHYFQGADGTWHFIDPKQRGAQVGRPVIGPDGKPLQGPKQRRPLQTHQSDHLESMRSELDMLGRLANTFQDTYAGRGLRGDFDVWLAQTMKASASPEDQALASWWSDFQMLRDLPQRNKTFGASLTANEKQSWARAQKINPGTDPRIIRETLAELAGIVSGKLNRYAQALVKDGYSQEAVEALIGALPAKEADPGLGVTPIPPPPPPPGTPEGWVPYRNKSTGEYRYNEPGKVHPEWEAVQ